MKVKELKAVLDRFDENAIVYVGCQGYSNFEVPADEYVINVRKLNTGENAILVADSGYYDDLENR